MTYESKGGSLVKRDTPCYKYNVHEIVERRVRETYRKFAGLSGCDL